MILSRYYNITLLLQKKQKIIILAVVVGVSNMNPVTTNTK